MNYKIVVLGDICPEWGYSELFAVGNPELILHDILPVIKEADYVVANLECPVTDFNNQLEKNSVNLKAKPHDIEVLKNAGIHAVSLANNHILDYTQKGLIDTIKILEEEKIKYYGVILNNTTYNPLVVSIGNIRVGFISFAEQEFNCAIDYGIGATKWDDIISLFEIKKAKKQCDYLIVQYHGGIENYKYPSPLLQKKCRAMADAGADLITCQHSHLIGTREKWANAEILYGQGNTIFGYSNKEDDEWNYGLICIIDLDCSTNGITSKISYLPIIASKNGEFLARGNLRNSILSSFEIESMKISKSEFIEQQWVNFCQSQKNTYLPMQFAWPINMLRMNKVLRGILIKLFIGKNQKRNAMNLIRCDSHREVIETILTQDCYRNDINI